MNKKQCKLIYDYMRGTGWRIGYFGNTYQDEIGNYGKLDLNAAEKCVQQMKQKTDWDNFRAYVWQKVGLRGEDYVLHLFNSINFFRCMGAWLEAKEGK